MRWLAYLERSRGASTPRGRFTGAAAPGRGRRRPAEIQRPGPRPSSVMADAIVERDTSLRDNLAQKDALMREIHHRVKNNLQVITSLLNMQQRALTDPAARAAMSDTRQRITALALIYRALYQSPGPEAGWTCAQFLGGADGPAHRRRRRPHGRRSAPTCRPTTWIDRPRQAGAAGPVRGGGHLQRPQARLRRRGRPDPGALRRLRRRKWCWRSPTTARGDGGAPELGNRRSAAP